ncbi:bifunctional diguanylate cyclase/phosphodiesterase [Marinobacterium stanieri]|uniref:cyclic-guanylate-specific phosphodiesterase n=1 Tax=Marinobacterium stanieri TaxID=49186 RepID=A0A1N6UL39_9GAMM|nr:EAL domain-containing protein [Marinobacterium stanieri]SIQ66335.1 PAS domain S-box-containing protein/diguanylate cyclase (GGDEF) domain-containing protein [Marinobacterium stanieri]
MVSKYPILDNLAISPNILANWQESINLIADIIQVPAALIMRVHSGEIEVFVKSSNDDNVYEEGERAPLNTGLYCETVMDTQRELLVANALEDPDWDQNPDIELGMISYCGLPLTWPSGDVFGTICVLDSKANSYNETYRKLIARFRDSIQLSLNDIYARSQESAQARREIQLLSQAVQQSPVSVIITDARARIEYVNPAFEEITGFTADEVMGQNPSILQSGNTLAGRYRDMWQSLTGKQSWQGEMQNRRKDGQLYWQYLHIAPVLGEQGEVEHYLAIQMDISYQKEQEEQLQQHAFYDLLTGLPNRALVLNRLEQCLVDAKRNQQRVAVLFIDLDDFKKVNDSLGHEEGDELLRLAAYRLQGGIRRGDTVGRFGGDEFVVLMDGITSSNDVQSVVEQLLERFRELFRCSGREFRLTASFGIALSPGDGESAAELMKNADSALFHAKKRGRNTYSFFTDSMNQEAARRLQLEEQMHGALDRGEFEVFYQPKVDVASECITGVEALLRWQNPVLGSVSPMVFIPVAEQTGLILALGHFVLEQSLQQLQQWQSMGLNDFTMAVNLSPVQFRSATLAAEVEQALAIAGLSGNSLELEITEGVLMSGQALVDDTLATLTAMGITIAMDDFGTGYSSLSYLRRYPFHVLKIDRSFVNDIAEDPADRELVCAAIAMAQGLGLKVVAEGVETREQLRILAGYGCDVVQGYLFSKPVTAGELTAMLLEQRKH